MIMRSFLSSPSSLSCWWVAVLSLVLTLSSSTGNCRLRIGRGVDAAAETETATTTATCPAGTKRLFVFIGPHRSAASSVEEFFMKYARGRQPDGKHGRVYHALGSMRWPLVYGPHTNSSYVDRPYKRYNLLLAHGDHNHPNKAMTEEIFERIAQDWKLAPPVSQIMIGGEEFDQIKPFMGDGPGQGDGHDTTSDTATATTSSYDSMDAVRDVVNYLNIPSMECVTIIINYRLPRFEHWMSMYNKLNYKPSNTKAMETTIDTDDDGIDTIKSYEQHMCGETDMDKNMRIRELGTTMNPMYLATQFLHEGYNVKMIDMSGIDGDDPERKGQDISHTIACEILNGRCTELGWVKGHEEESIQNAVLHGKTQIEQQLIDDGEKLFQYRDCAYKYELERHAKFSIVDRTDIWKQCGPSTTDDSSSSNSGMAQIYNSLRRGVVLKKETIPKENGKGTETSIRFDNSNGIGSVEEGNQLLFEALLSQVECSARSSSDNPKKENKDKTNTEILVTMKGVLNGQYIDDIVTLASTKGGDKNKQVAALIEDEKTGTTVGSSNGGGDGDTSSFSWVWIVIGSLVGVFVLLFIRRRRGGDGSSGKYGRTTRQYEETEMTGRQQPQRSGRGGIRRSGGRQQKNQNGGRHNYNNTIPVESSFKDEASDSDDDSDDNDDDSSASSLEDIKIIPKSSLSSVSSLPPVSSSNQSPSPRSEQPSAKKAGVMQGLFSRFGRKDNITNSATAGRINNNARNIDDFIPNAGHPPFYSDDDNNHNNGYADDTYYNEEEDVICFDENNNDGDII